MELGEAGIELVTDLRDIRLVWLHMPVRLNEAIIDDGLDALIRADAEANAIDIVASCYRKERVFPLMRTDFGITFS